MCVNVFHCRFCSFSEAQSHLSHAVAAERFVNEEMLTRGNNEDLEKHCQSEKKEAGWYCNPYTHIRPVYTWYYHSYYSQVIQSQVVKWDIGVYTCFFICISNVPLVNTVIGFQGRVSNFVISYARVSLHVDKGYSESNIKLLLSEM